MLWSTATEKLVEAVPSCWLDPSYYDSLNALFRSENALRLIVFVVLKNALKDKWDTPNLESDEKGTGTIASIAKRRRAQDRDYGYLGHDTVCPLLYLTAGELTRLVLSDAMWPHFKPCFSASKAVVESKLSEISNIRNRFAHFRPIRPEDAAQVRLNATQVLSTAETMLMNMLGARDPIPTNCDEEWYKAVCNLSSECVTLRFLQSVDGLWIRLVLDCECATLGDDRPDAQVFWSGRTTNVVSPAIYERFPPLQAHSVCMTEAVNAKWNQENRPPIRKLVRLFFSRAAIAAAHPIIAPCLRECIALLGSERELLIKDHLAHGKIVKPAEFWGHRNTIKDKYLDSWTVDISKCLVPVAPTHPAEYWGTFSDGRLDNLFTETAKYPWMPVTVSKEPEDDILF